MDEGEVAMPTPPLTEAQTLALARVTESFDNACVFFVEHVRTFPPDGVPDYLSELYRHVACMYSYCHWGPSGVGNFTRAFGDKKALPNGIRSFSTLINPAYRSKKAVVDTTRRKRAIAHYMIAAFVALMEYIGYDEERIRITRLRIPPLLLVAERNNNKNTH
jgi:hypothetical protein